ncbi:MAG: sugar phosphate nucleotidyltransferase [Flavitalea sp.]
MKAIIFSAGLGTRFKPWTDKHPKALAEINGKSLLQRNVEYLQKWGISDVVVNVHHFADQIENAIAASKGWGSKITVSDERDEVLETGGGLKKAAHLLGNETFLAINVDILIDVNIKEMITFHRSNNALATLGVSQRTTTRYFLFDKDDQLCGWENLKTDEKKISRDVSPLTEKAFSGIHVIEADMLPMINQSGKFSIVDVYLDLSAGNKIVGYDHTGCRMIDVGKPESVAQAEEMFQ